MSDNPHSSTPNPDNDQGVHAGEFDNINKRTGGGTGREYLIERLRRAGRTDLLDGIAQRQISAYAAAVQAGIVRRRRTAVADGDHNLTRRRQHEMQTVLERSAAGTFACAELPCLSCNHPDAWRALKEVANTYVASRKGELPSCRSPMGVLPPSCCRRTMLRPPPIEALIG
jgi:hypothetical protein